MIPQNRYPASSTQYIYFASYNSAGASVTLTGLAVTDIEIYKNGSVTQRASDNGYTLLDTDGIDFDGITGLHGFSIDLSDNSDSGFYAVGSKYVVVVSTVTVDSQTVTFIADRFEIVAAESVAGKPKVDVDTFGGSAGTFASGRPEVNTSHIAGSAVSTSSAQIGVNVVNAGGTAWASGAITAAVIANGAIDAATFAADVDAEILSYLVDDATRIDASALNALTPAAIANAVFEEEPGDHTVNPSSFGGFWMFTAGQIFNMDLRMPDTISLANINAQVDTAISDAALATAANLATVDTVVDAVKAVTDQFTFTVPGQVDSNIQAVNDQVLTGTGVEDTDEWRPV